MNKKLLLLISIIGVLLIAGGVFYWQKFHKKNTVSAEIKPVSSPSPIYPKVENFEVPILMYHYIRNAEGESELGKNLSVSPENFQAQIKYLKEQNYQTIKLADLADPDKKAISKVYFEKKKPIIITFDDGYKDAYTAAFPVLKKYELIGTFYIIRDYVGRENRLTVEQIDEMKKAGMEIGSHSMSHPDLTKISLDEAQSQIFDSREQATTFCYPSGKYNQTVVELVKQAGYSTAVTTKIGLARETSNLLELPRVRVENVSPQALMDKISYAQEFGN